MHGLVWAIAYVANLSLLYFVTEMVGACFAIFFLALLYEGLKVLREYLLQRSMVQRYAVQHEFNGSASGDTKVLGTQNPG